MNTKTIKIEESGLTIDNGKSMILGLINGQISTYKMQHQLAWEENHNISSQEKNAKIDEMRNVKDVILNMFKSVGEDNEVSITLNLEVKVKKSKQERNLEEQIQSIETYIV